MTFLGKSTLTIYLDWLDEVRKLLGRHGGAAVEAWQSLPAVPDRGDELRSIANALDELASELRDIADAIQHEHHRTDKAVGGRR